MESVEGPYLTHFQFLHPWRSWSVQLWKLTKCHTCSQLIVQLKIQMYPIKWRRQWGTSQKKKKKISAPMTTLKRNNNETLLKLDYQMTLHRNPFCAFDWIVCAHAEGWRCFKEIRGEQLDSSQESQWALQQQALERQSDGGNSAINTAWACGGLCLGLWSHMCERNQPVLCVHQGRRTHKTHSQLRLRQ